MSAGVRMGGAVATLTLVLVAGCSAICGCVNPSLIATASEQPSATATPSPTASPTSPTPSSGITATTAPAQSAPPGATRVEMYALAYHPGDISLPAGTLSFFLVNPSDKSSATHTMAIGRGVGDRLATSDAVPLGTSAIFTVQGLAPGTYVIWCTIDGHAAEGMVGTLTIH